MSIERIYGVYMAYSEFVNYIEEILEPFGPIKIKRMFGGYGIYKSEIIFAIIDDNEIYFKAGLEVAEYFKSKGSEAFVYDVKGKTISMSYFKVPEEILEDKELLAKWVDMSYYFHKITLQNKT